MFSLRQLVVAALLLVMLSMLVPTATSAAKSQPRAEKAEAETAFERHGIDYASLRDAAAKEPQLLAVFMSLRTAHVLDAAAADGFCMDLHILLKKHGEKPFATALATFSKTRQLEIVDDLLYDVGASERKGKEWETFRKKYPKLAAIK